MSAVQTARSAASALRRRVRRARVRRASTLAALAAIAGGDLGVHARHLGTGRTLSFGAGRPRKLASLVKVPLAVRVLREVGAGRLALDTVVPVEPRHVCAGSGVIAGQIRLPGLALSVENLLRLSLAQSDNTATDVLFDLVGGPAAVQAAWGGGALRVDRTIRAILGDLYGVDVRAVAVDSADPAAAFRGVRPSRAHAREFFADPRDTATPETVVDLLADLWAGRLLPPDPTAWLVSVLGTCTTGGRRAPAGLPRDAVVVQKTGTFWAGPGRMVADAVVFRAPDGGHVALAAFLTGSRWPRRAQEAVLARAAGVARATLGL